VPVGAQAVEIGVGDRRVAEDRAVADAHQLLAAEPRAVEVRVVADLDHGVGAVRPRGDEAFHHDVVAEDDAAGTSHHEAARGRGGCGRR
jgi:hypothetical protein